MVEAEVEVALRDAVHAVAGKLGGGYVGLGGEVDLVLFISAKEEEPKNRFVIIYILIQLNIPQERPFLDKGHYLISTHFSIS